MAGWQTEAKNLVRSYGHFLTIAQGGKHDKVINLTTKDWIPLPKTPGDCRALRNFKQALSKLAECGEGLIHSKNRAKRSLA